MWSVRDIKPLAQRFETRLAGSGPWAAGQVIEFDPAGNDPKRTVALGTYFPDIQRISIDHPPGLAIVLSKNGHPCPPGGGISMDERLPRKLAAILCADVAGYSRLTGEDEDATHRTLSEQLELISSRLTPA